MLVQFLAAPLRRLPEFKKVVSVMFVFFLVFCRFNGREQGMYLILQFRFVFADRFAPHKGVAIGIRLDLSAVNKLVLQRYILFVRQKLNNGGEYGFKNVLHSLGTEAIKGAEVCSLPSGQPHEGNILPYRFGDLVR